MKMANFNPGDKLLEIGRQSRVLQVVYAGTIEVYVKIHKKSLKGKIPES